MRARAILFAVVVLAGAGFGAWKLGGAAAVGWYEEAVAAQTGTALAAAGQDWADRRGRRPRGRAEGRGARREQPVQRARDRPRRWSSRRGASTTRPPSRPPAPLPPPPIALELLRNDADISLIGLVPETGGRDVIRSALGAGGLSRARDRHARDPAEPAPDGWSEALGFGLSVVAELPRAKVSVAPGRVGVVAVADSDAARGGARGAAAAGRARRGAARPRHLARRGR